MNIQSKSLKSFQSLNHSTKIGRASITEKDDDPEI